MQKDIFYREKVIIKTSLIGIITNLLLASFKAFIGLLSKSIAITLDALNNVSDAASSLITIVGAKLASRKPDKKHPFGYGRIEYLSALVIAVIVLYAGIASFIEAIKKIIKPELANYSKVSLFIIGVAIIVKIVLGGYAKKIGKELNSDSLINSGEDATLDSIVSVSTLLAAIIYLVWGISLEAYLGAIISLIIIKSGIEMLKDTLSRVLGESVDIKLANEILNTINLFDEVKGAYDLILNNYGPNSYNGSVHITVNDNLTAGEIDALIRDITAEVFIKHHVILNAIGIYSINTSEEKIIKLSKQVEDIVLAIPYVKQMHGFYVYQDKKILRFDVVVSFSAPDRNKVYKEAIDSVKKALPDYKLITTLDMDFNEE